MLKINDNPPQRFPVGRSIADDTGLWRVARVKPRHEKALAKRLMSFGVAYYLPLNEKRTRRPDNGKPRKSLIPLFPGYLPFAARGNENPQAFETDKLTTILEVKDQQRFIDDLAKIQLVLESGLHTDLWLDFEPGTEVKITAGPMKGLVGELVRKYNREQFVVRVDMFNTAVSVNVDSSELVAA